MNLDITHPQYDAFLSLWTKARDFFEGQKSVKDKREVYLPRPSGMVSGAYAETDYQNYLQRARLFNATQRTVENLVGLLFLKPAVSDKVDNIPTDDMDGYGSSLQGFHKRILLEILITSRVCIWVDWDDYRKRAYAKLWRAERLLDWHHDPIKGDLTMISLDTSGMIFTGEKYEPQNKRKVLKLENGVYTIENYIKSDDVWLLENDPVIPNNHINDKGFSEIPFKVFNNLGLGFDPVTPMLIDLIDVNWGHYINSADYEWNLHNAAQPAFYGLGITEEDAKRFSVGPQHLNYFPSTNPNTKLGVLEMAGTGAKLLAEAMKMKEQQMVVLGSRVLETPKLAVEAADTLKTRLSGDKSNLDQAADVSVQAMRWTIGEMLRLAGFENDNPVYDLDRGGMLAVLAGSEIKELVASWQSQAMSRRTLFYNFERGGLYPDGWTAQDEADWMDGGNDDTVDNDNDDMEQ